jgi:hypothetical protein
LSDSLEFSISKETLEKMVIQKKDMGFSEKSWDDWFNFMFKPDSIQTLPTEQIQLENIIGKTIEQSYDVWVRNFAINLNDIWNGSSAKDLEPKNPTYVPSEHSAIIIGAGPSIKKHDHLKLLADSDYKGSIICTDKMLAPTLKAGITPDRFPKFYVATIDPLEVIRKFYDDKIIDEYGNKINAIFSTVISPSVIKRARESGMKIHWLHALYDYHEGKKSFNQISALIVRAKNHPNGLPAIQTGGNVGTSSWFIAWKILKCSTVALIGINHGWNDDDPWEEIFAYSKTPLDIDRNNNTFKKAFPRIYNPDFDCHCIQNPIFQYYGNALKEFIARSPQEVATINATEGGAIFGERIKCMTFKNFLSKYKK